MFSQRLEFLIDNSDLSKRELAKRLNTSHTQINRYIRNENEPTINVVIRIASTFGVSTDFLLGISDNPTPAIGNSNLSDKERDVIALWRQEKRTEAISIIANDSIK